MSRPNILLVTCDQYRFPRFSYGADHGFAEPLKRILGFSEDIGVDNPYAKFFPGLLRLRRNAVLLRNHTIAASACTPSRATIYTGQYGTKTGVTQTDGLFKNGDSPNFPWLAADGIPTLGNWMREAGYATHYFGKWHVSNPPDHSLQRYGFDNWEQSYPEPHGAQTNNLGLYRDAGFTDSVCAFIRRQALALNYNRVVAEADARDPDAAAPDPSNIKPWFAVASFVNPHDIATYPAVISQALPSPDQSGKQQSVFGPLTVPLEGQGTPPPTAGTAVVPLNPLDFPQDSAHAPPTMNETLDGKPSCQHDYAYKMGLALAAKTGYNALSGKDKGDSNAAVDLALRSSIPFQLTDHPDEACRKFIQLYAWLHAVVDAHIDQVLQTLEETGQASNTIVVFFSDHGEYAAAHGMMMEKWHAAYQEALHVPVVVQFPPGRHDKPLRASDALTSHIDMLPTVLGLAGVKAKEREDIARKLSESRPVPALRGVDLSPLLRGETDTVVEPDGKPRQGVLFITDDEITEPLPPENNAHNRQSLAEFALYDKVVAAVREGHHGKGPVRTITPGPVRQPNHVRCVRTREYKLSRYFDPSGKAAQQWEMYDLTRDPNEVENLVQVDGTPPKARETLPAWTSRPAVQKAADELAVLLAALERRDL
ncbi:sulfatase-like hydrolase/transferase [Bradyrhizobium aeschynomenes]|uniref:sulfatase-like hydrolase/transferase n=1 Tax=Bradyrhizobium aeschynomenes TaxID=2734909 RepID=UPI001555E0D5|nr:sulfatase-like hydrolase/transferase [Bradyrhizobium aeschynomenes]NPV20956.1 sulfatase-like hydrolase/transferase [Bradyrhizobium aeschynomenes]